ncbi:hypothetical protein BCV72DRAFT_49072 [Rhizopus microsporus var. microsporus]|uniref:Uncharacterized protein n=1 Tax=Rhizopus microsporus var. microsporus TaxID=86635 RepID=A0A1X0QRS2_RHIZD|nr:hypothetical protein BCV72DRAFT_49072 [Rhizopus microsporus var. microsporus]
MWCWSFGYYKLYSFFLFCFFFFFDTLNRNMRSRLSITEYHFRRTSQPPLLTFCDVHLNCRRMSFITEYS